MTDGSLPPQNQNLEQTKMAIPEEVLAQLIGRIAALETQSADRIGQTDGNLSGSLLASGHEGVESASPASAEVSVITLPGAFETREPIEQDVFERRAENKLDLLESVQAAVEPYRDALIGELVARAPQHKRTVAPPPRYADDPKAWRRYVGKRAQTIGWDHVEGKSVRHFSLTYLPQENGNRLVGFKSDTHNVLPNGRKEDETEASIELQFDRGELVEAGLGCYKVSPFVSHGGKKGWRDVRMTVGSEPTIAYRHIGDTVYTYSQDVEDGTFVDTTGKTPSVTSRVAYMSELDEILGSIPKVEL
jgi:hypothetical protein